MDFFTGLFGVMIFVSLMLVIPAYAYFRLVRHFIRKEKAMYSILLVVPFLLFYLYNFTNTFYCLECAVTLNKPSLSLWNGKNDGTLAYHYNCFDNSEEQVYWLFDWVNNFKPTSKYDNEIQIVTNVHAAHYDDSRILYEHEKTDFFAFAKNKQIPDSYTEIRIIPKGYNLGLFQSYRRFSDSIVYTLKCEELDFYALSNIHFTQKTQFKENFTDIWKNMKGKTLVIVHYFNYGEYFKVEFPNRKKE